MATLLAMPDNPVALYWEYYWASTIQGRIINVPTTYNIIFYFNVYPAAGEAVGGNTGAVTLRLPGGTAGTNLVADIATCQARGQRVLLSIGGAGGQVYLQTQARADAFVASIKAINVQLGGSGTTCAFNGLDFNNFEGTTFNDQPLWMTYAAAQLKAYYGANFLITSPPASFECFAGGQGDSDRQLLATMYASGALDWMCPQFYDPSNLNTIANVRTALTWYHAPATVNGASVQIPRDHIGIGFGIVPSGAGTTSRWSVANANSAFATAVAEGYAPKGGFNWSVSEDPTYVFGSSVGVNFTNYSAAPTPAFAMSASSQFADGAATTAQLTAPAGKTSGANFFAGKMAETSNPITGVDITTGNYTELEYCVQATANAVNGATYEFRITDNGATLDTYSVTPQWTIGTASAGSFKSQVIIIG